ncbi:hypothetical protein L195_g051657, partial [Trifolium pratense]
MANHTSGYICYGSESYIETDMQRNT